MGDACDVLCKRYRLRVNGKIEKWQGSFSGPPALRIARLYVTGSNVSFHTDPSDYKTSKPAPHTVVFDFKQTP